MTDDPHQAAALLAHTDATAAWLLLGAHIGVGLLAAAYLRRGERALTELLRAATALGFRPLLLAVTAVSGRRTSAVRRLPRATHRIATARERLLVHSLGRRGPPCSVLLAV
jgi:hypothetical protein